MRSRRLLKCFWQHRIRSKNITQSRWSHQFAALADDQRKTSVREFDLFGLIIFGFDFDAYPNYGSQSELFKIVGMTVAKNLRAAKPLTISRGTLGFEGKVGYTVKIGKKRILTFVEYTGSIFSINVWDKSYRTAEGVFVGMPLNDLEVLFKEGASYCGERTRETCPGMLIK